MSLISLAIIVFIIWLLVRNHPSPEAVMYWSGVIEEGQQFLLDLKDEGLSFEEFSKLPDRKQDKVTRKMGYKPDTIDLFVGLAEEFPQQSLMKPKYSRVYREYRVTRQAMRRFPGSGGFKMGPF